jgi:hypothetical protein
MMLMDYFRSLIVQLSVHVDCIKAQVYPHPIITQLHNRQVRIRSSQETYEINPHAQIRKEEKDVSTL